nr:MAG TPA: hypothetical protein [Inoviridae sp.]
MMFCFMVDSPLKKPDYSCTLQIAKYPFGRLQYTNCLNITF